MLVGEQDAEKMKCPQAMTGGKNADIYCCGAWCMAWRWADNIGTGFVTPVAQPTNLDNQLSLPDPTKPGYCGLGGPP